MAQLLFRSHRLFFFLFYIKSLPENIRDVKLALHFKLYLAEVVFIFVHQLVHMLISFFVCLIQLIVQQLTVVYTKAAALTTSTNNFVNSVKLFFRKLSSFKLGKNDFDRLLVF